jgi:hypothetical protein
MFTQAVFNVEGFSNCTWQKINYSALIFLIRYGNQLFLRRLFVLSEKIFNLTFVSEIEEETRIKENCIMRSLVLCNPR